MVTGTFERWGRLMLAGAALLSLLAPARVLAQADASVERALASLRLKASSGDAVAQHTLGSWLFYVGGDAVEALRWFRAAAAQEHASAELQLGYVFEFGLGLDADPREALNWYRRSAEHGNGAAARAVGDFYRTGRGVDIDLAEAARWYRRGAEAGDIRSQYHFGQLLFDGTGVPRDYSAAYVWFALAASQAPLIDNRKGIEELRNIAAARMTEAEVAEAERRVRQQEERSRAATSNF
jgi:TPR repeat protein